MTRLALFAMVALLGCGGDDGGGSTAKDAAVSDGKLADAGPLVDAPVDAKVVLDAPAGTFPLTVKNFLNWCSVSVDGGTASTAAQQVVNVMPGTITLTASGAAGFTLGPNMWHHTSGDGGSGEAGSQAAGTSTAMVTVGTAAKCVWVCCPFTNGTGCENTVPEQCP